MKTHPTKRRCKSGSTAAEIWALTRYVRGTRKMLERMVDQVRALPPGRWVSNDELAALAGRRRSRKVNGKPARASLGVA